MSLADDVKAELLRIRAAKSTARAAEVTSVLRFAGGLQMISGRMAVEAEVTSEVLAMRLARELNDIYGVRPQIRKLQASSPGGLPTYIVRVHDQGETLARRTGLLDERKRPVRGLPNRLTTGSSDDLAAIWRGAFLARGTLSEPGRTASLDVICPNAETAMALVGAAGRIGIPAKAREVRGVHRVVIREGEAITHMLALMGAKKSVAAWDDMRQRRETRAQTNRLVNFDDANLRRSAQAAVAACARVERALEILGDDVPEHLLTAGRLRLAHREASLDELGHAAEPPMTKDAVAGRIRRLLGMADKRAEELGIPGTEAFLPEGIDDVA